MDATVASASLGLLTDRFTLDFSDYIIELGEDSVKFYVLTSDLFVWGFADVEEVTETNFELLVQSVNRVKGFCEENTLPYYPWVATCVWAANLAGFQPMGAVFVEHELLFPYRKLFEHLPANPGGYYGDNPVTAHGSLQESDGEGLSAGMPKVTLSDLDVKLIEAGGGFDCSDSDLRWFVENSKWCWKVGNKTLSVGELENFLLFIEQAYTELKKIKVAATKEVYLGWFRANWNIVKFEIWNLGTALLECGFTSVKGSLDEDGVVLLDMLCDTQVKGCMGKF